MTMGRTSSVSLLLSCAIIAYPARAQGDPTPPDAASTNRSADQGNAKEAGETPISREAIEDIIVTAERRTTNVQRVASAVSVRSGEDLRQQGKYSLNQILENVPGISGLTAIGVGNLGSDAPETGIAVRGVKTNSSGTNQGLPQSATTAVYVDGVYGGVGGSYDLDRVEVLRGPQGTLYGRSATGGVIATYTRNPVVDRVEGFGLIEIGNYRLRHYSAAVNVPLIDDALAVRVSGDDYRQDGYYSKTGIGRISQQNLRVKVLANPTENLSVLLGYGLSDLDAGAGGVTFRLTRTPDVVSYDFTTPIGGTKQKIRQYWAQIDWTLGGVHLTYLPSLRDYKQAGTTAGIGPGGQLLFQAINVPYDKFYTHELHLGSESDSRFVWQVGAISFNNTARGYNNQTNWVASGALLTKFVQDRKITDVGAFAEGTYSITDKTRVTAGLRYDKTKINTTLLYSSNVNRLSGLGTANVGRPENVTTLTLSGNAGRAEFSNFNYKLRLEQDLAPGHLLYAGVSSGSIPGDIQIAAALPPVPYVYKAEQLTAYEIGSKNRFFGGKLQANLAAFYYDYGGFQTMITPDLTNPTVILFVVAPARFYGGELEVVARPTPADELSINASQTTPHWVSSPPGFKNSVGQDTIAGIIKTKINGAYSHVFTLPGGSDLRLRGELIYQGGYQPQTLTAAAVAADFGRYSYVPHEYLGNLSIDWTSADKRFEITGYIRNVGNNKIRTNSSVQALTPTSITGSAALGPPRTYGVVLRANF